MNPSGKMYIPYQDDAGEMQAPFSPRPIRCSFSAETLALQLLPLNPKKHKIDTIFNFFAANQLLISRVEK